MMDIEVKKILDHLENIKAQLGDETYIRVLSKLAFITTIMFREIMDSKLIENKKGEGQNV